MPRSIAACGVGLVERRAVDRDRAGGERVEPEQDARHLRAARAHQAGDADDLARLHA